MGDLEDLMFKQNVPGRYSSWLEEQDDRRRDTCCHDDVEGEAQASEEYDNYDPNHQEFALPPQVGESENANIEQRILDADIPDEIRIALLSERDRKHQTGVKGVLADYKANKALKEIERDLAKQDRESKLWRMAEGAKVQELAEKNFITSSSDLPKPNREGDDGSDSSDDSLLDGDDEDDEDDAFMREFRAKRLQQLKSAQSQIQSLPTFGQVKEITTEDFIDEVDKADSRVFIVVHLYEPSVQGSTRMNRIIEELAVSMPKVKFLRMNASSNGIEVDRVTLPILTLYKGGETVEVFAGLCVEFGDYFQKEEIEWLLENHVK